MFVTDDVFQDERSWSNDIAPANVKASDETLQVSHEEMSSLNSAHRGLRSDENIRPKSVISETHHDDMGYPYRKAT
jgi:hypothetical protein